MLKRTDWRAQQHSAHDASEMVHTNLPLLRIPAIVNSQIGDRERAYR